MKSILVYFLLLSTFASNAFAHEVRPAYLELRQSGSETYNVLWKVPGLGENLRLGLYVELPQSCSTIGAPNATMVNNAYTERWSVKCPGGLDGATIYISGLKATKTDVLVRLQATDGSTQVTRLTPAAPAFVVQAAPDSLDVARTYIVLGVEHILAGLDHLLFVLALLIVTGRGWTLIKTVTAFTIAHTCTLTAATLGILHVPQQPVEAIIALSIVFVAAEIINFRRGTKSITVSAPWLVAFSFGLIHGLGFAGALRDTGLPHGHIPTALLFFSLGVEAGHLLFVAVILSLLWFARRIRIPFPRWAELVPPYAIGTIAMFWLIQRITFF